MSTYGLSYKGSLDPTGPLDGSSVLVTFSVAEEPMSRASRLSPRARRNFLLTSGRPLIEFNRVSVGIFHEVGSVDDAGGGVARRCHALRHLAGVQNHHSQTAELPGSRFDLAFPN